MLVTAYHDDNMEKYFRDPASYANSSSAVYSFANSSAAN